MSKVFKTGDKVIHPSHSHTMTVDYLTKSGEYNCKWHEEGVLKEGDFKAASLSIKDRLIVK